MDLVLMPPLDINWLSPAAALGFCSSQLWDRDMEVNGSNLAHGFLLRIRLSQYIQNYLQAKTKYKYKRWSVTTLIAVLKTKKNQCPGTSHLSNNVFWTNYIGSGTGDTKMNTIHPLSLESERCRKADSKYNRWYKFNVLGQRPGWNLAGALF